MRGTMSLLTAAAVALLGAGPARADDAKALVDKAIKAVGGAEKLAKYKAETYKGKGKFYGMGEGIDFTGEWAMQLPDRMRVKIDVDANGMQLAIVRVANGDKVWMSFNGTTTEVDDKDEIAETRDGLHHNWVASLLPLKDKAFTLALVGEEKVGDRPAVGVKASHKGRRDINLFFDKEKGLLLKTVTVAKGRDTGGKEVTQETLYSDYKEEDGIKRPRKVVINRDGKVYIESEMTELKPHEKLDDATFAKP